MNMPVDLSSWRVTGMNIDIYLFVAHKIEELCPGKAVAYICRVDCSLHQTAIDAFGGRAGGCTGSAWEQPDQNCDILARLAAVAMDVRHGDLIDVSDKDFITDRQFVIADHEQCLALRVRAIQRSRQRDNIVGLHDKR